jgi:hypothetical protein
MVVLAGDTFAFLAEGPQSPLVTPFTGDLGALASRLAPGCAASPVHQRFFRLTPRWSLGSEVDRLFKLVVLRRTEAELRLLEPPAVWARELPALSVFPLSKGAG